MIDLLQTLIGVISGTIGDLDNRKTFQAPEMLRQFPCNEWVGIVMGDMTTKYTADAFIRP